MASKTVLVAALIILAAAAVTQYPSKINDLGNSFSGACNATMNENLDVQTLETVDQADIGEGNHGNGYYVKESGLYKCDSFETPEVSCESPDPVYYPAEIGYFENGAEQESFELHSFKLQNGEIVESSC